MNTFQHLYHNTAELLNFINVFSSVENSSFLIQILSTDTQELHSISEIFSDHFEKIDIVGVCTPEFLYNGSILNNGTLIIVTIIKALRISVFYQEDYEFTELAIPSSISHAHNSDYYIQIFSMVPPTQSRLLIQSLKELIPNSHIHGGILPHDSLLYYNAHCFQSGYIGIIFYGSDLHYHNFNTTSVIPIGREHTVTHSKGHKIDRIDDIPAKQFYINYLGNHNANTTDSYIRRFPLMIQRNGLLLPSPITEIESTDSIFSSLPVQNGDIISLGYGDINYYIKEMAVIHQYLPTIPCQYFFGFFSQHCLKNILDHTTNKQLNLPVTGLLTQFEFVESAQYTYLSCDFTTLICMSTDPFNFLELNDTPTRIDTSPEEIEHSVLLKLIENTSKELNALNRTLERIILDKTNELQEHYYTDQLTKLPNTNRLYEDLDTPEPLIHCLCLIDISAFININNFYGARVGNKILMEIAQLLIEFSYLYNYKIYRVHSDVFAIANYDGNYRNFSNRMRILQTNIHKNCFISVDQPIFINTIFAVSNIQLALYENTSMTLQHAKAERITFLMYDEKLNIEESIINNLTWTSKIRRAIDEDRIVPFFQPIYNNKSECIDRFEVLMRLVDDDGIIISPLTFLPIAKKAGLYDKLTQIIIRKTFEYFEDKPYKFSINLSAEDIKNAKTRSYIFNRLVSFSKPHHVIFEIVESESIENYEVMIHFINEIKRVGAQIAIDDFGTGFSNFHYLFKLNVDCIKIDGSIIQEMSFDPSALIVAETIVDFANKMGITTVAEYVSDEKIFKQAQSLGIDFSQGYFVASPASEIVM